MTLKIVSPFSSSSSAGFTRVPTYADLPAGGDTVPYGVELSESQHVYEYVDKIGSVGVGRWWPYHIVERISDLYTDAGGNKCFINCANGDDIASVTARGWAQTLAGSGTMIDAIDAGRDVIQFGINGAGTSQLAFTPTAFTANEVFVNITTSTPTTDVTASFNSSNVHVDDGTQDMNVCCSANATNNSYQGTSGFIGVGQGVCTNASYQNIFIHFKRGNRDQTTHILAPDTTSLSTCYYIDYFSGFASQVYVNVGSGGNPVVFNLESIFAVELT